MLFVCLGFSQRCLKQNLKSFILAAHLDVKTVFCLPVNVEVHNEAPVSLTVNINKTTSYQVLCLQIL